MGDANYPGAEAVLTRSWRTGHSGELLICAAKKRPSNVQLEFFGLSRDEVPLGMAVAIADLVGCIAMTDELIRQQSDEELGASGGDNRLESKAMLGFEPLRWRRKNFSYFLGK
ncbi:MAG: hypothetical protein J7524_19145 [Roseofilum sp. Belize BBD 4]|uniref:hypothetical protein n=1 Tax=Roseofilum sp. Belize BBD 4 TaxID=2821500 RepID=UPI001B28C206|nr:hypothetical protein [Roseofilum sp. Belize BBD 4]MBP0035264.1 hypothetical protein [Roseofilum sp. Belize BBD 4]